ncbi:MAG: hypothetical protein GX549_01065 [Clostridiales bacterium]|nr:hypothetical protein [Clostridiales bacterium]
MKKTPLLLSLILSLLMILMTACGNSATQRIGGDEDDTPAQTRNAGDDNDGDDEEPDDDEDPGVTSNPANTDVSVAGAYGRYIEAKSASYESLSAIMDESDQFPVSLSIALLPIAMIDLAAIPMTLLQADNTAALTAAGFFGFTGLDLENDGRHFRMSYKTEEESFTWEGDFDAATDSVTCTVKTDDKLSMIIEFSGDGGWASQHYSQNDDGTFSLIKFMTVGDDYGFGLTDSVSGEPPSIFKNNPDSFDYIKDCETWVCFVDGKGESMLDGEITEFE